MPLEKFPVDTKARAVPVTDGITAKIIGWPRRPYMKLPQSNFYIDKGTADGVALGDLWEVRRASGGISDRGTVHTSENLAMVQIVNVREHSATALILNVKYATFNIGTPVVQVAKLPQ